MNPLAYLSLLLLLILSFTTAAQNYQPTLVEGREWTAHIDQGLGATFDTKYKLQCDTIIDNQNYFMIRSSFNTSILGFAREDVAAQQVFYRHRDSSNEVLILDYSLEVGDPFRIHPNGAIDTVLYIDTVQGKRIIHFHQPPAIYFTEGTGHSFYGINEEVVQLGYTYITGTTDLGTPCSTVNIKTLNDPLPVKVFPNPFQESIQIEWETFPIEPPTIRIYDMMGILLKTEQMYNNQDIDCSELPRGLYLLEINRTQTLKLIKN